MSIAITEFKFNQSSFVQFWTRIQQMLNNEYGKYDYMQNALRLFDFQFEQLKSNGQFESIILQESIWKILNKFYHKTPLEIFVEFFKTIRDNCFQGGFGHHINLSRPLNQLLTPDESIKYKEFFKVLLWDNNHNNNIDEWPHHYVLHPNAFYKVKTINIEVYFALIALGSNMYIDEHAENEIWSN